MRKNLVYYVFDVFKEVALLDAQSMERKSQPTQAERYAMLLEFIPEEAAKVQVMPFVMCHDEEAVRAMFESAVERKHEGIMIKDPKAKYQFKRTKSWYKFKPMYDKAQEEDVRIIRVIGGTGKYIGMVGALLCEDKDGIQFKVGTGFTDDDRKTRWEVGSFIEVNFQERSRENVPRFPVFVRRRPDRDSF
jgi:DNA ligase-1